MVGLNAAYGRLGENNASFGDEQIFLKKSSSSSALICLVELS